MTPLTVEVAFWLGVYVSAALGVVCLVNAVGYWRQQ